MKQKFVVEFDCEEEVSIGQVGVPIMNALKLKSISVDKAAQQGADGAWDCPKCKKPNIAVASKCWFCETPRRSRMMGDASEVKKWCEHVAFWEAAEVNMCKHDEWMKICVLCGEVLETTENKSRVVATAEMNKTVYVAAQPALALDGVSSPMTGVESPADVLDGDGVSPEPPSQ